MMAAGAERARPQVWIIEDDPAFQFVYEETLGRGYTLTIHPCLKDFSDALKDTSRPLPSLLIADVRLPDRSFLSFLESSEAQSLSRLPYIVVSAFDDVEALDACYKRGALDFITKPFGRNELVYKVERYISNQAVDDLKSDTLLVKNGLIPLQRKGNVVPLTNKEHQIIAMFQEADNQTLTRTELLQKVWGKTKSQTKTLDVHLHNLRKKIASIGLKIQFMPPNRYVLQRDRPTTARGEQ